MQYTGTFHRRVPTALSAVLFAVLVALVAGCSAGTPGAATTSPSSASVGTTDTIQPRLPSASSPPPRPTTAAPVASGPGTVCDPNPTRRVVINRGSVDCAQAIRIINATPGAYEAAPPSIEGWACVRAGGYGFLAQQGYNYRCDRGGDQVLAQDNSVPVANNWVDAHDFYRSGGGQDGFYFTTPLHKFDCAIIGTTPADAHAGCHGRLNAAPTINQGPQFTHANTIESVAGDPGRLIQRGDPEYQFLDGGDPRPLEYAHPLFVNGYTCTTNETTGTTCTNFATGHGFTVLVDHFRLF